MQDAMTADGTDDDERWLADDDRDSQVLSLPDIYFDYSDLSALKNSSPALHVCNSCSGFSYRFSRFTTISKKIVIVFCTHTHTPV